MRKITEKAVSAFLAGRRFSSKNTTVEVDRDEISLVLFGNRIATRDERLGVTTITTAGWHSNTTKERLNGLPGVRVHTSRGQLHLNGEPWDGKAITLPA